jgi:hypothetical protein
VAQRVRTVCLQKSESVGTRAVPATLCQPAALSRFVDAYQANKADDPPIGLRGPLGSARDCEKRPDQGAADRGQAGHYRSGRAPSQEIGRTTQEKPEGLRGGSRRLARRHGSTVATRPIFLRESKRWPGRSGGTSCCGGLPASILRRVARLGLNTGPDRDLRLRPASLGVLGTREVPCDIARACGCRPSGHAPFVYRLGRQIFNLKRRVRLP